MGGKLGEKLFLLVLVADPENFCPDPDTTFQIVLVRIQPYI
jgi:hypothetical protein